MQTAFPASVQENRITKGLQKVKFRLDYALMNSRNRYVMLLCAAALAFSLAGGAVAVEQQRQAAGQV